MISPSGLTYSVNPAVYAVGTAIPINTPSTGGGIDTFDAIYCPSGFGTGNTSDAILMTYNGAGNSSIAVIWVNPSAGGPVVAFPNGTAIAQGNVFYAQAGGLIAWDGTSAVADSVTLPFTPGNVAIIP